MNDISEQIAGLWNSQESPVNGNRLLTTGDYATEAESASAFDETVNRKYFACLSEVPGQVLQPRPHCSAQGVRIDRILLPTSLAIKAGWTCGTIGVELKASNVKSGPVICQCMDYMRSSFFLPTGNCCILGSCFIWPLGKCYCDIASIMAQHRIGSASLQRDGNVMFWMSGRSVFFMGSDYFRCDGGKFMETVGMNVGSR